MTDPIAGRLRGRVLVRRKILLADDDAGLRQLIGATLGSDEFDLLNAVDGEDAHAE